MSYPGGQIPAMPSEEELFESAQRSMGKPTLTEAQAVAGIRVVVQTGHASTIHSIALSTDGRYIITGSRDETAKLWDVASAKEVRTITGLDFGGRTGFVGDSHRLIVADMMNVQVVDADTGLAPATIGGLQEHPIISGHGRFAAHVVVDDGEDAPFGRSAKVSDEIAIIDLVENQTIATLPTGEFTAPSAISDDGRTLIVQRTEVNPRKLARQAKDGQFATPETQFEIWDVATRKRREHATLASTWTGALGVGALSPDGRWLVREQFDQSLEVIDLESGGTERRTIARRQSAPTPTAETGPASTPWASGNPLAFSADGRLLGVVHGAWRGEVIHIWAMPEGRLIAELEGSAVNFSADGKTIVAAKANRGAPFLMDLATNRVTEMGGGASAIGEFAVINDGRMVVAATATAGAKLWDLATGELLRTFECPGGAGAHSVSVSGSAPWLATGCFDGGVYLWNLQSGAQLRKLVEPGRNEYGLMPLVRFDPTGKRLAVAMREKVSIRDAATGQELQQIVIPRGELPFNQEDSLAGIVDNEQIPQAQRDAIAAQAKDPAYAATMHLIHGLEFHPDGQRIAVAKMYDLSLWDIASGQQIRAFSARAARAQEPPPTDDQALMQKLMSGARISRKDMKQLAELQKSGQYQGLVQNPGDAMEEITDTLGMEGARDLVFTADGRHLVALGVQGKTIWEVDTGRKIRPPRAALDPSDPMAMMDQLLGETEMGTGGGLAVSPDGRTAARGHARVIKVWDLASGQDIAEVIGHTSDVSSLAFVQGGRVLVSGASDGTVRLWSVPAGREIVQLVALGSSDYVAVTPDQFYRASRRGIGGVAFRVDDEVFPFEQFDLRFNRPDIVLERLGLAAPGVVQGYRAAYLRRLRKLGFTEDMLGGEFHLPQASLAGAPVPLTTSATTQVVRVRALDEKYPLDRIHVFVNDVPVFGTAGLPIADRIARQHEQDITIPLVAGRNKIQVSVLNQQGAESFRQTTYTTSTAAFPPADVYIVAIGVSQYQHDAYNLRFAAKDAADLIEAYRGIADRSDNFGNVHVLELSDARATRSGIRQARAWLEQARVNDLVVLFAAGHGMTDSRSNYFFGTYDIDPEQPGTNGLPYEEFEALLDGIPALQKVLLIDTCFSGEIDKEEPVALTQAADTAGAGTVRMRAFKASRGVAIVADEGDTNTLAASGAIDAARFQQEVFADLRRGTGAVVISSASGNEYALEGEQWANGVFTYAILDGLRNGSADLNADGTINVSELQAHVIAQVPKLTNGGQNPTVRRENLEYDFPVY